MITTILYIVAFGALAIAAFNGSIPKVNLVALGLGLWLFTEKLLPMLGVS